MNAEKKALEPQNETTLESAKHERRLGDTDSARWRMATLIPEAVKGSTAGGRNAREDGRNGERARERWWRGILFLRWWSWRIFIGRLRMLICRIYWKADFDFSGSRSQKIRNHWKQRQKNFVFLWYCCGSVFAKSAKHYVHSELVAAGSNPRLGFCGHRALIDASLGGECSVWRCNC